MHIHTNPMFSILNRQRARCGWGTQNMSACEFIFIARRKRFFLWGASETTTRYLLHTMESAKPCPAKIRYCDTGGCVVANASTSQCMLSCIPAHFNVQIRSFIPTVVLHWVMKLQIACSISFPLPIMHRQQLSCPARLFINSTVGEQTPVAS